MKELTRIKIGSSIGDKLLPTILMTTDEEFYLSGYDENPDGTRVKKVSSEGDHFVAMWKKDDAYCWPIENSFIGRDGVERQLRYKDPKPPHKVILKDLLTLASLEFEKHSIDSTSTMKGVLEKGKKLGRYTSGTRSVIYCAIDAYDENGQPCSPQETQVQMWWKVRVFSTILLQYRKSHLSGFCYTGIEK